MSTRYREVRQRGPVNTSYLRSTSQLGGAAKVLEALESVITDGIASPPRDVPNSPSEVASRGVRTRLRGDQIWHDSAADTSRRAREG